MNYIRYHEVEQLLRNFQALKGMREVLQAQIQTVMAVNEDESELIENLSFNRNLDGLPKAQNTMTDRTGNVATAGLRKSSKETSEATKAIAKDLILVDAVVRKLEIALNVLLPNERKAVELKYFEGLNWYEIADETSTSVATAQRHRRAGIERIRIVARITISDYKRLMKILNLN